VKKVKIDQKSRDMDKNQSKIVEKGILMMTE